MHEWLGQPVLRRRDGDTVGDLNSLDAIGDLRLGPGRVQRAEGHSVANPGRDEHQHNRADQPARPAQASGGLAAARTHRRVTLPGGILPPNNCVSVTGVKPRSWRPAMTSLAAVTESRWVSWNKMMSPGFDTGTER